MESEVGCVKLRTELHLSIHKILLEHDPNDAVMVLISLLKDYVDLQPKNEREGCIEQVVEILRLPTGP